MRKLLIKLICGDNFTVFLNSYIENIITNTHQLLIDNNIYENMDEVRQYLIEPTFGQLITLIDGTHLMYDIDHTWYILDGNLKKTEKKYPNKCSNGNIERDIKNNISGYSYYY